MKLLLPASGALLAVLLSSCTSLSVEEVRDREAEKTRKYAESKEKQRIRREAREERNEIWYDTVFRDDDDF